MGLFTRKAQENTQADPSWYWVPQLWCDGATGVSHPQIASNTPLCDGVKLFHSAEAQSVGISSLTEGENTAIAVDVRSDLLNYLSLVIDLPDQIARTLTRDQIVELDAHISALDSPVYARLNLRYGPNTEHMNILLYDHQDQTKAEFDLWYSKLNAPRMEKAWIDLIVDNPPVGQITISDLALTRRKRAQF